MGQATYTWRAKPPVPSGAERSVEIILDPNSVNAIERRVMKFWIGVLGLAILLAAGCGGDGALLKSTTTTTTSRTAASSVIISGKSYTCETITATPKCSTTSQKVFDRYKNNIDTYVQTDKFGPFNDAAYADLALMGLFACTYKVGEQQKYIDLLRKEAPTLVKGEENVALLPAWFAAHSVLCPGGRGDGDVPI
jgi:hypothetical protein